MGTLDSRRPRPALPFTVISSPGSVRLVAGEDFRYTLGAEGVDQWLPPLFASFDGRRSIAEALAQMPAARHTAARQILERLFSERVLVDGTALEAHVPAAYGLEAEGRGPLLEGLRAVAGPAQRIALLCQDRLDYDEALRFNRRCLEGGRPWMWATTRPLARGYAGPVFLPGSGPCLACLIRHFRRRSPAPEIYDALAEQGRSGKPLEPATFPAEGVAILRNLVLWKAALLADLTGPAAPFRLHVLDAATLEVSSHRIFRDPECEACGGLRR